VEGYPCQEQHPMYRTTSHKYGSMGPCHQTTPQTFHGISSKFSEHLNQSGMYRNQSLNTSMDKNNFWRSHFLWFTEVFVLWFRSVCAWCARCVVSVGCSFYLRLTWKRNYKVWLEIILISLLDHESWGDPEVWKLYLKIRVLISEMRVLAAIPAIFNLRYYVWLPWQRQYPMCSKRNLNRSAYHESTFSIKVVVLWWLLVSDF